MGRTRRLRYRHLRRTIIAVIVALAVMLLLVRGLWRVLESEAVCSFTARRLERTARAVAGINLEIGSLGWSLVPPRMIVSDVRINGPSFRAEIDHAAIEPGGLIITRRTVILDSVEARGIRFSASAAPSAPKKSRRSPVRLIVRNLDLREIDADPLGLADGISLKIAGGEISWLQDSDETRGVLSVERLDATIPGVDPFSLSAEGTFGLRKRRLSFSTIRLRGEGFAFEGQIDTDGHFVQGTLGGRLDLVPVGRILRTHGLLEGRVIFDADFNTRRPTPLTVDIRSDRITAAHFPVEDIDGSIGIGPDGLWGDLRRSRFFGGVFRGRYELGALSSPFPHSIEARCDGMDIAALLETLGVPPAGLSSRMDVSVDLEWNGRQFKQGDGTASIILNPSEGALPISGRLQLGLGPEGLLRFEADGLKIGSSTVSLEGPLMVGAWAPEWGIHAEPVVLEEILPAVNRWIGSEVFPPEVSGGGSLDVGLSGPWKHLRVTVTLDSEEIRYSPITLDRLVIDAEIAGGRCVIENGRYRLGDGGGRIEGAIRWIPGPGEENLDLRIDGRGLPLADMGAWIDLPEDSVSGEAAFTGALRGSFDDPYGSWALGLKDIEIDGVPIGSGSATVDFRDTAFSISGLRFDEGLSGRVRWDLASQDLEGDLAWTTVPVGIFSPEIEPLLGTTLDWTAAFDWTAGTDFPTGRITAAGVDSTFEAEIGVSDIVASMSIGDVVSGVFEAQIDDDSSWSGDGNLRILSIDGLARRLAPNNLFPMTGSIEIPMQISGTGTGVTKIDGRILGADLQLGAQPTTISGDRSFHWDAGRIRLDGLELSAGDDHVYLKGRIDPDSGLQGNLSGSFDARLLRVFLPDWEPAGRVTGTIELLGALDQPLLEGIARIERGSFRLPGTPSVIGDLDGALFLSAGEIAFEDFDFKFMRGRGRGRGRIAVESGEAFLHLGGTITGLDFPLFPDFVPRIDGRWFLEGPVDDLKLSGDLDVIRAEVRRQDDLPSILMAWFGEVGAPREDALRLDLHVRAERTLVSRNPFVRLIGSADLTITGTDAHPGIVGTVEFTEGGEFVLQGIRYELERGQISFSDPTRIDPMLDFQARATIREYDVWLGLTGTMDRLIPIVSSDPPLSPPEIYSLMALGSIGSGGPGGAVGLTLASSLLTRRMNEVLGSRKQWLLPVDQIRVDPFVESTTGDPSARVTVVKQLSPSITVTLQSNLSGESQEVISARWYLGSGFFIEASRDNRTDTGNYGLDFKLRRRY